MSNLFGSDIAGTAIAWATVWSLVNCLSFVAIKIGTRITHVDNEQSTPIL
jgi:hypothetical protein